MAETPKAAFPDEGLVIDIDFSEVEEIIQGVEGFPEKLASELTPTMELALQLVEAQVVLYAPYNRGALQTSINHQIISHFPELIGTVGSPLIYAPVMEFGRRSIGTNPDAKMPPISAIRLWVRRKFGLKGRELNRATWAMAKHILYHGTKGKRYFQKALKNTEPTVRSLFEAAISRATDI